MFPMPSLSTEEYRSKEAEGGGGPRRKAAFCCPEAQALTPPVVKLYPERCQSRGVLIRQTGKQRLSLRVLQLCMTLGIIESKDRELIFHSEPLQPPLSPTGSVANKLSIKKN